jgi:dTDP-D-glucose 4,6-dehydratase
MVTTVEDRNGRDRHYSLDDSGLCTVGYAPRVPFAAGSRSTVQWFADIRELWEPLKNTDQGGIDTAGSSTHRLVLRRTLPDMLAALASLTR